MYPEFKDKVVLITGASSGIGKATALAFAREGAKLMISDVQDKEGEALAKEIRGKGADCLYMHCDISRPAEVKRMVDETVKHYGRLDIAYNNAGIEGAMAPTADGSEENFDRVIGINLKGVWACMKYEIPEMLKNKKGVIVNCSSIAGVIRQPRALRVRGLQTRGKRAYQKCRFGIRQTRYPCKCCVPGRGENSHARPDRAKQPGSGRPTGCHASHRPCRATRRNRRCRALPVL
ncbi:MAG: SDR family NAD(P)-dependent oxidoreductase [Owenweeksia sp.]|nr:SDR family NAD(P)-dependent oxidoreductase [Owenweeksia sp.]